MKGTVSLCSLVLWCVVITTVSADRGCKDITTFNLGLIPGIPGKVVRRPAAFQAIKDSGDDFMCLQEVWFEEDLSALIEEVKSVYPYHYSKLHHDVGALRRKPCMAELRSATRDTPCTATEAARFAPAIQQCAVTKGCVSLPSVQQGLCIILQCADVLRSGLASENCISCLVLHNPQPITQSLQSCMTPKPVHNKLNDPGLVILSKSPISDVSYSKFFPENKMSIERGYIRAKLDDGKLVVCTHFTSIFQFYSEYDLSFGSYVEQHKAEVRVINDTFSSMDHILLGDLNTGPAVENPDEEDKTLTGEFPDNYKYLMDQGYLAPYMELDGHCTYCENNILTGNYSNNVIDQVLIYDNSYSSPFAIRMFDTINVGGYPVSDHYGVQVQVCDL